MRLNRILPMKITTVVYFKTDIIKITNIIMVHKFNQKASK